MHPSGAFRVQPHFVRSLARSASLPGCGCPFGTSIIKNKHTCTRTTPEGWWPGLTWPRHDHDHVCDTCEHIDPIPYPFPIRQPVILTKRHANMKKMCDYVCRRVRTRPLPFIPSPKILQLDEEMLCKLHPYSCEL